MTGLIFGVAVLLVMTGLERFWTVSAEPARRLQNIMVWLLGLLLGTLFQVALAALTVLAVNRLGGGLIDLSRWGFIGGLIAYAVLMDLGEYGFHRAQHAIPWMWRMHSLHHSDPNINATTTGRHFWGDSVLKSVTIWAAVGVVFKASPALVTAYGLITAYNYFTHANLPVNLARWSWVINSPAYHRAHHSSDPADYDTNFAAILPIFDVMTGAYRQPRRFAETGLDQQPRTAADVIFWPVRYGRDAPAPDQPAG